MAEPTLFARIDHAPPDAAAIAIGALERMAGSAEMRRVRASADEFLPASGRVLDAGCGLGEVARGLAARGAEVVALDHSETILAAARQRHDGGPVTYTRGDITALPFPDAYFDAARTERVLQHLDDPDAAVSELARVTRPGGTVCLIDTDWESITADGVDRALFDELRDTFFGRFVRHHRDMGRTLRRRLVTAGLTDIRTVPVTMSWSDASAAGAVLPAFNAAALRRPDILPGDLTARWQAAVEQATAADSLLVALTMWVAAGTVDA